ncbi:MAG: hypothetical protein U0931_37290 [Vulcanimicrobiota bacterium]
MRHLFLIGLLLLLAWPLSAQQIFVRNRPFKSVRKVGSATWVELKALAAALGIELKGDEQSGYCLAEDAEPPGAGKVALRGVALEASFEEGGVWVALETAGPPLGARVVRNKEMGSIDVTLMPSSNPASTPSATSSPGELLSAPYNLLEYGHPPAEETKYIQNAIAQARAEYPLVHFVFINVGRMSANQLKYKPTKNTSYPEVALVDAQGNTLFTLRGNHVIDKGLLQEMRKAIKR